MARSMRPLNLPRAKWVLIFAIATCSMFAGSGLIAQIVKPSAAATSPAATVSNATGQDTDEVAAAEQEPAKASAIKKADEKQITPAVDDKNQARLNLWSPSLVSRLSLGIGCFAVFILICVTVLLKRLNDPIMPEQILRTFGILVIIFAAIFLVIAGYSDTQITPVIGLLGTIAGYLLGRKTDQPPARGDGKGISSDEKKSQHNQP